MTLTRFLLTLLWLIKAVLDLSVVYVPHVIGQWFKGASGVAVLTACHQGVYGKAHSVVLRHPVVLRHRTYLLTTALQHLADSVAKRLRGNREVLTPGHWFLQGLGNTVSANVGRLVKTT